jgi:hypothetical protein
MKKQKRVALLGNMNNNFFNLARYLRDLQYDAHLFIFPNDPKHFHPEADSYAIEFTDYVHYLSWGNPFDLLHTPVETILSDVGGFDHYIVCGTAPAYFAKANIQIDLMVPYGSDLYDIPFFKIVRPTKLWHYFIFTKLQRKGIRLTKHISIADSSALFKRSLQRIGFRGKRIYSGIPLVYTKQYAPDVISKYYSTSAYFPEFKKIRDQFDLVILHNSRHCWKDEPDPVALKDNHKLFQGVSAFLKKYPDRKVAIITFEYGHDVPASKQLCQELGIEKNVFWFPLMPRKEIMMGMSLCDIVAGEFRNSWFTYGVVFEAMALAKPVMHYREDKLYPAMELYPMIYAKESSDISNSLEKYYDNKDSLQQLGEGGKVWFERNIVEKSLADISTILKKEEA